MCADVLEGAQFALEVLHYDRGTGHVDSHEVALGGKFCEKPSEHKATHEQRR
jgi:hypothetical protein